jgi:hypothetical protein
MPKLIPETWETFTFELEVHGSLATIPEPWMTDIL